MNHYADQWQELINKENNKMKLSTKLTNEEYRAIDAISNGELQQIANNPGDYIWNKKAPIDATKTAAFDFGTALHTALLEPEQFNDSVIIYGQTKTRDTVKFHQFMETQEKNAIVLLESEYDKLRFTVDSALAHPAFKSYLESCEYKEASIVGEYRGIKVKIRPDICSDKFGIIGDLKSSADLSDWRDSARWKNPLFKLGYGHTAAFYMDVYQEYLGRPVNEYTFLVCQKSINCGKYPVAVIVITRDELEMYGFFDKVYANIDTYKQCVEINDFNHVERFPIFSGFDDGLQVSFEGDE
jgi:exodeoxyribonuclease VIII